MKQTNWPDVTPINQKNYYTYAIRHPLIYVSGARCCCRAVLTNRLSGSDYMKRDDQVLALRLQAEATRDRLVQSAKDRDRALARNGHAEVPLPVADIPPEEAARVVERWNRSLQSHRHTPRQPEPTHRLRQRRPAQDNTHDRSRQVSPDRVRDARGPTQATLRSQNHRPAVRRRMVQEVSEDV